jgi:hypothetical protein
MVRRLIFILSWIILGPLFFIAMFFDIGGFVYCCLVWIVSGKNQYNNLFFFQESLIETITKLQNKLLK